MYKISKWKLLRFFPVFSIRRVVKDATSPTYMGAYTSGGGITASVICSYNGSSYSWLTD